MNSSQTFKDHILEARRRLIWVFGALAISGVLGYVLRSRVVSFIQKPLGSPLYYNSPAGSFNFIIKATTIFAVFVTLPVIFYHLVKFVEPALPIRIKRGLTLKLIFYSFILATLGSAFGYYIIIPMSLHFFNGYASGSVRPLISADSYLSFVINILVTFALLFQIPLLMLFINFIKPLKPKTLLKIQKYVIIGALVLAVILPFTYSPISQFILAAPIILLYYLSILLVYFVNRSHARALARAQANEAFIAYVPELAEQPVLQDNSALATSFNNTSTVLEPTFVASQELIPTPKVATGGFKNIDGVLGKDAITAQLIGAERHFELPKGLSYDELIQDIAKPKTKVTKDTGFGGLSYAR